MITGWEIDNKNYVITNNGRVAAKLTDTISTLFSQGPQFDTNHIIEFKVVLYTITSYDFIMYIFVFLSELDLHVVNSFVI